MARNEPDHATAALDAFAPATATVAAPHVPEAVQELLGHGDVTTTIVCTQVSIRGPAGVRSLADALLDEAPSLDPCIVPR